MTLVSIVWVDSVSVEAAENWVYHLVERGFITAAHADRVLVNNVLFMDFDMLSRVRAKYVGVKKKLEE